MQKLYFSIEIDATSDVVYQKVIGSESYSVWTKPFSEGGYFEGSWNANETIRFLGPDGNGMLSEIAANTPNEFISIRHIGMIENGVEDTQSDNVKVWAPAYENYTLREVAGKTEFKVELDNLEAHEQYMQETWPKALLELKRICEAAQ
ncbi:MAG: hypothetical protein AUK35_10140 [Zetaproteobacteria bacterium CG2_30_46_52]|nr:MAG: hypothetical protein AUK35_10140 [Zetaproteobacteria bacterium CG2_30_46_52]